ncbi:MAG: hypothetical protein HY275_04600 [Gemmatimonadetes bacterium]|nr:hypothetical protein [Gemmatimonadota bacterium]
MIATWGAANAKVHAAMLGWTESSVEQAAIVHPLIGPLTVREMLFFQHYHEAHHLNLVAMRRGAGAS